LCKFRPFKLIAAFFPLILLPVTNRAGEFSFGGSAILTQPIGARQISMGETFTAVADDLNTIYYNPAGLATVNKEASITYLKELSDTYYTSLSLGHKLDNNRCLGATVFMFKAGSIDIPVGNNTYQTVSIEDDYLVTLSYAKTTPSNNLALGMNFKYLNSTLIEKYTATAMMMDLGLLYKIPFVNGLTFGAAAQNIGAQITYGTVGEPLPATYRTGLAYRLPGALSKIRIACDLIQLTGCPFDINTGIEYTPVKNASLRAGYRKTDSMDYFSFGLGVAFKGTVIDYGQTFSGEFDATNQFTLAFGPESAWLFGSDKKAQLIQKDAATAGSQTLPLANQTSSTGTEEGVPALEKELIEQIEDELIPVFINIKKGFYLNAKSELQGLISSGRKIKSWEKLMDKLTKTTDITNYIPGDDHISTVARKGILSFLRPDDNPRDAIIKLFYCWERTIGPDEKEKFNKLYSMLRSYYPEIAKNEKIPDGFTLIDHKLYKALNFIYDGHYDLAIQETKEVLEIEPENILALKRLGSALYALGTSQNKPETVKIAQETWEKASKLAPNDTEIQEFLKKTQEFTNP